MPRALLCPVAALFLGLASVPCAWGQPADAAAPAFKLRSVTIVVRDYDEAKRWFTEKLGFEVGIDQTFAPGKRFLRLHPAGQKDLGIVLETPGDGSDPAMPRAYHDRIGKEVSWVLEAADAVATYELLRSRGVVFTQAPKQMPWGTEALFKDLYGNTFVIIGPRKRSP